MLSLRVILPADRDCSQNNVPEGGGGYTFPLCTQQHSGLLQAATRMLCVLFEDSKPSCLSCNTEAEPVALSDVSTLAQLIDQHWSTHRISSISALSTRHTACRQGLQSKQCARGGGGYTFPLCTQQHSRLLQAATRMLCVLFEDSKPSCLSCNTEAEPVALSDVSTLAQLIDQHWLTHRISSISALSTRHTACRQGLQSKQCAPRGGGGYTFPLCTQQHSGLLQAATRMLCVLFEDSKPSCLSCNTEAEPVALSDVSTLVQLIDQHWSTHRISSISALSTRHTACRQGLQSKQCARGGGGGYTFPLCTQQHSRLLQAATRMLCVLFEDSKPSCLSCNTEAEPVALSDVSTLAQLIDQHWLTHRISSISALSTRHTACRQGLQSKQCAPRGGGDTPSRCAHSNTQGCCRQQRACYGYCLKIASPHVCPAIQKQSLWLCLM